MVKKDILVLGLFVFATAIYLIARSSAFYGSIDTAPSREADLDRFLDSFDALSSEAITDTTTNIRIRGEDITQIEYSGIRDNYKEKLENDSLTTIEAEQLKDVARREGGVYLRNIRNILKTKANNETINNGEADLMISLGLTNEITDFNGNTDDYLLGRILE